MPKRSDEMIKEVKYKNESGFTFCVKNKKPYYCEKIDAVGLNGSFTSDTLARAAGQITTYKNVGARTVVCDFAVWLTDKRDRTDKLNYIINVFNPMKSGILTLVTDKETYNIECYPSAEPSMPKDDNVNTVYRFTVDFICDYPYFKQQGIINKPIINGVNIINSSSVPDTPVKIYIPDCSGGAIIQFRNALGDNTLRLLAVDEAVTIDTDKFTATSESGKDVSNKIDLSSKIENCKLTYGKNKIILNVPDSAKISYYNLVLGVI